jgi:hypothetical protein
MRLKNNYRKHKLFINVLKTENFIYFIQTMEEYPDFNEEGEIIKGEKWKWIGKCMKMISLLIKSLFDFDIDIKLEKLLSLGNRFGGVAIRSIKTLLAAASINALHKINKKIWNDMKIDFIYFSNNIIKQKMVKIIGHYNLMVDNKYKVNIDDVYDDLDIINQRSHNILNNNNNIHSEMVLKENIKNLELLMIDNGIKSVKYENNLNGEYNNIGLNEEEEDEEVIDVINNIDKRFRLRNLMRNIDMKYFHDLLNDENDEYKTALLLSYRSPKNGAFLQSQIGAEEPEYILDNDTFSKLTRIRYGKNIYL